MKVVNWEITKKRMIIVCKSHERRSIRFVFIEQTKLTAGVVLASVGHSVLSSSDENLKLIDRSLWKCNQLQSND